MSLRVLFGPVSSQFAADNLAAARADGSCLTFGPGPGVDVAFRPGEKWDDLCSRLPADWRPDLIALYLPYTVVPASLWQAPVPLVALAADWNLLWSGYIPLLPHCERVLTDSAGLEALGRAGIQNTRYANLFGCGTPFLGGPGPDSERDIDCLFVGNPNTAIHRERADWLGRLALLPENRKVVIASVFGKKYRELLDRAKVVFNRSVRGECNKRVFEAVSRGCLLFQERGNREVEGLLRDGGEAVFYEERDLLPLLEHYLANDGKRRQVARAAWQRAGEFSFEALWKRTLAGLHNELPELRRLAATRRQPDELELLRARTWQATAATEADPWLVPDLQAALRARPQEALLHALLAGAVAAAGSRGGQDLKVVAAQVLPEWERACHLAPHNALYALARTEALILSGRTDEALKHGRHALWLAGHDVPFGSLAEWDVPCFPPVYDDFRVDWQRLGWETAELPELKRHLARLRLIRWRLHTLLATLTGDLNHYHAALHHRPDFASSQAALGCALGRAGRHVEAREHLRDAVARNPLDGRIAQALAQVLRETGDEGGYRHLAQNRRRLHRCAPGLVRAEQWAEEAPPTGQELASIIIPCCNGAADTRVCLETLVKHTDSPYEVILVDNGSTDDSAAAFTWLRGQVGTAKGLVGVEVLRNEQNLGFAAACNQGLRAAKGRYLVLLNNDTALTPGWLGGLIYWAIGEWPRVGLVGPVSNGVPQPQWVPAGYQSLGELDAFARQVRRRFRGKALPYPRVSGFCLLLRREVYDKVGELDERFGPGFFEDDDYCFRVADAGYKLLIAQDVYVHHAGSSTFKALGLDTRKLLEENFGHFVAKWGTQRTQGYRLPEPAPQPSANGHAERAPAGKQRVSICLIVKNEEANLRDCLEPVLRLADEVVVNDTGSTDRTRDIARELGVKLIESPWQDSFAAARNQCIEHATGDWIFWLDADDRVDEANVRKLAELFARLPAGEMVAYNMKCRCLPDAANVSTVVDHIRLFPRHPEVRWAHRVHEQILPAVRKLQGRVEREDIEIQHTGYQDPALRARKLERDLRLLHLELEEQPGHPFTLFNLGSVFHELRRHAEALPLLQQSLRNSNPRDSIVRKLYALIAACQRDLGQTQEALRTCVQGQEVCPDDAELPFAESLLREQLGDLAGAEACLLRLLTLRPGQYFASVSTGLTSFKARHNLAILYRRQGRHAEAEAQWKLAREDGKDFVPALLGLAELWLEQGRWAEVQQAITDLEGLKLTLEAAVLRARVLLGQKDYAGARAILEPLSRAHPHAAFVWLFLSHTLLQQGQDLDYAERVLRTILELEPGHPGARRNLEVLLYKRGRAGAASACGTPGREGSPQREIDDGERP